MSLPEVKPRSEITFSLLVRSCLQSHTDIGKCLFLTIEYESYYMTHNFYFQWHQKSLIRRRWAISMNFLKMKVPLVQSQQKIMISGRFSISSSHWLNDCSHMIGRPVSKTLKRCCISSIEQEYSFGLQFHNPLQFETDLRDDLLILNIKNISKANFQKIQNPIFFQNHHFRFLLKSTHSIYLNFEKS